MSARNDPNYRRAVRHAARLGAMLLVYVAATAMAARKESPGVHVTETGFTIVESAKIDGATRSDYARAAACSPRSATPTASPLLQADHGEAAQADRCARGPGHRLRQDQ